MGLPTGIILTAIKRKEKIIIPRGDVVLEAEPFDEQEQIKLKEIVLRKQHPWTGGRIRDLAAIRA